MQKKIYKTKNIYLAAILLALGAKLENTDRSDPRHQEFEFSSETGIEETANKQIVAKSGVDFECIEKDYANKELMINAWDFQESIQRMKALIHSS